MPFKKMDKAQFPPRQWALVGAPGAGKSSFAAQMVGPLLVVDSDHRFTEVARLAKDDVFMLSDEPSDNVNAERIAALLKENMAGSGIKTIVVDSLTSIITPLVVEAIMDNDAGRNKNRVSAFKDKALSLRLIQDTITGFGVNTLWIYHTREGLDGNAKKIESTSISVVELARLRRSLNMILKVIEQGDKRGIHIEWARRGRSGMTLWDDSGCWKGFPEKIETAVYGGLTVEDMERIEDSAPASFASAEDAISWGFERGAFRDAVHAKNSYDKLKAEKQPKTAQAMWDLWKAKVQAHLDEIAEEAARSGEHVFSDEEMENA